jgi:hypothetical protein
MSAPVVPHGQSPPFAVVTETDHSAWIIIGASFGLSCVLLFSVIRVCVRFTIAPAFGLDDIFLGFATVCLPSNHCPSQAYSATDYQVQVISVVQSSITLYAASRGLGKSAELVNTKDLVEVQKVSQHCSSAMATNLTEISCCTPARSFSLLPSGSPNAVSLLCYCA